MLQLGWRDDARRPAVLPPSRRSAPAGPLRRLQGAAGNHAVTAMLRDSPQVQRTLHNVSSGGGMAPGSSATWPLLNPLQKAAVRRMQKDVYQQFSFLSPHHMFAYVISQIGPTPAGLPAPVAGLLPALGPSPVGAAHVPAPPAPVIVPLTKRRQADARGSLGVPGAKDAARNHKDPAFRAYTREGRARYAKPTDEPRSNWSHFVEAQVEASDRAWAGVVLTPEQDLRSRVLISLARQRALELDAVHELPGAGGALAPALGVEVTDPTRLVALGGTIAGLLEQEVKARATGGARTTRLTETTSASRSLEWALDEMWKVVLESKQVADPLLVRHSLPVPTLPRWGPVIGDGIGTWVHARFTPEGSWAAGSSSDTTSNPMPWNVGRLSQRKKNSWVGSLYVQGHLLNDHLGGPALAYNLVPLVGEGSAGTSHANLTHFYVIENRAKDAVKQMLDERSTNAKMIKAGRPPSPSQWAIERVEYSVVAQFEGHGYRARARSYVDGAIEQVLRVKLLMMKGGCPPSAGGVTLDDLNTAARNGQWGLSYDRDWAPMKDAIDAVVPGRARSVTSIDELVGRFKGNAALWGYEDAAIPSAIAVAFRSHSVNGAVVSKDARIENVLPTLPTQPFVWGPG